MSEGDNANCPYCGEPVAGFAWEAPCTCPGAVVAANATKQRPDELLMKLHDYWQNDKLEEWSEHHQTIDALKTCADAYREVERLRVFPSANTEDTINAARHVDWQQVICHQGEPCFHLEYGQFCLRARYWAGHSDPREGGDHSFVPLDVAITGMVSIDAVDLRTELTEARATIEAQQQHIAELEFDSSKPPQHRTYCRGCSLPSNIAELEAREIHLYCRECDLHSKHPNIHQVCSECGAKLITPREAINILEQRIADISNIIRQFIFCPEIYDAHKEDIAEETRELLVRAKKAIETKETEA